MIKAMEHGVLPPTLHVAEPTPHVDWESGGVRLLTENVEWGHGAGPRRAGVSSFGISGTNAHVILESVAPAEPAPAGSAAGSAGSAGSAEVPEPEASAPSGTGPLVWAFSAKTETALLAQAARLRDHASAVPETDLAPTGLALVRRTAFPHRAAVVAAGREDLVAGLAALAQGEPHPTVLRGEARAGARPVFLFPGQGTQWAGMAVDLLGSTPVFAERLAACDAALRPYTGWSVLDVLRGADGAPALEGTDVIQPVLFAVMVSLAEVWRSLGVRPAAVVGHSQGEIAAACVCGALSLEDAAKVVALRSRVLTRLRGTGGMLAVALSAAAAESRLRPWDGRLWVAVHSGPSSCVVAGDADALDEFAAACGDAVRTRRVAVDYASHTPHMEELCDELLTVLDGVRPRRAEIAFCSSLEGGFVETSELSTRYWFENLRGPVRFQESVRAVAGAGSTLFVEVGPHPVLGGDTQDICADAGLDADVCATLRRGSGDRARLLTALAHAWVLGADADWTAALGTAPHPGTVPPTYAFEHRRFWLLDDERIGGATGAGVDGSAHPLLTAQVAMADEGLVMTGRLTPASTGWLADHAVEGALLLPGTAFVELALEALAQTGGGRLDELVVEAPLVLPRTGSVTVQVVAGQPDAEERRALSVFSRAADADTWQRHASGVLSPAVASGPVVGVAGWAGVWPPEGAVAVGVEGGYEALAERGYEYGPAFQGVRAVWRRGDELFAEVSLPDGVEVT
ncbi:acyltransferase domain-containing protein, partial [Microbispora oryzae]